MAVGSCESSIYLSAYSANDDGVYKHARDCALSRAPCSRASAPRSCYTALPRSYRRVHYRLEDFLKNSKIALFMVSRLKLRGVLDLADDLKSRFLRSISLICDLIR